ncbi:hypothetical protein PO909_010261 [Leuciscus waleckii]
MAKAYPGAFRDVIEGEIVGSGYDSLIKQMISRLDNVRQAVSNSEGEDTPCRKKRLDTYGCLNWQPVRLPPNETPDSQKRVQEELKKMYKERCPDTKCIENMMRATFFTQRKDIFSGIETSDLMHEWPYLFETVGMKTHFKELTGMDIDKSIASKCARVTTLPSEVDCAELPRTPCIIVCGSSPLNAEYFLLSVDQVLVNSHITIFSDAVRWMFASYYCLNISYPADQGATLEFLQR